VRRPLVLGAADRLCALARVQSVRERTQTLAQGLDFLVLAVDDIAELRIGALQEGELQLQSFFRVFVHGRQG